MKSNSFSIGSIFLSSLKLRSFLNKAEQLIALNRVIPNYLDPVLARHCKVTHLSNGILILTTASSAVGHQLRMQSIELLTTLRGYPEWCGLKSIKVHVRPDLIPEDAFEKEKPVAKRIISKNSSELIKLTASAISQPRLRQALMKLSLHIKNGD